MKRIFLVIAMTVAIATALHAQRLLPGTRGLEIRTGMVDGIYSTEVTNPAGYSFGAAMSTYTRQGNKWVFGAEFLEWFSPYRLTRIPISQFTAEGGYYFRMLSDPTKTVSFYFGCSGLGGYETINRGDQLLYDGALLQEKDGFVYGGAVTLEMETYISDRIVLLLNARERILWGTKHHFRTQFGVGLKFIFN